MSKIKKISGRQIIDSRGNPTIEANLTFDSGITGRGMSPSGASTGKLEALELRDNDNSIYLGKSVLKAVNNINTTISNNLDTNFDYDQSSFDKFLIDSDGTENKSNYGANAILALSLAFAHANANEKNQPLYKSFTRQQNYTLPVPLMNIINGGAHANNNLDFQEFMILPIGFKTFSESLRAGVETFHTLKEILNKKGMSTSVGDEGGFAPNVKDNEEALNLLLEAINQAGYIPGENIYLGLDVASSEFYSNGVYTLNSINKTLKSDELSNYLEDLCDKYPIISIEDGMAEDDWDGWRILTKSLGEKVQLVGDDIFVTNPEILMKGIDEKVANSILIKLNQIGTVTETLNTIELARKHDYNYIISHRSGETEDVTIADLSVATFSGQIKTGSLSRSDRTSKYNQLLRIEEDIGLNNYNSNNVFGKWL
ncbi:MAG: phosphopyruvate hydratase [Pseudomonadota bacterium]|nr:phosphopyruvate hydratase [Pseudomonadota bacterium]